MSKRFKKVRREAMIVPGRFRAAKVVNGNIEAALRFFKRQNTKRDLFKSY